MKLCSFWLGLLLASVLLFVSFTWQPIDFWILFPLSLLILSIYARIFGPFELKVLSRNEWAVGLGSGLVLYLLFAFGKWLIQVTDLPLLGQLLSLYDLVQPKVFIDYLLLFLIIIPGEEWFWRGFIVKRLSLRFPPFQAVFIGTLLYAGVHLFSGSALLVLAALIAGMVWSYLFLKTKNLSVVIVSHIMFDALLLIILPVL